MGTKALKKKTAQKAEARVQKVEVKVTSVMGDPSIEQLENGRQIVLWIYVEGHGRIKVQSTLPGIYHANAVDPGAASAAEAGAGEYCEQHGDQLHLLYGQLAQSSVGPENP